MKKKPEKLNIYNHIFPSSITLHLKRDNNEFFKQIKQDNNNIDEIIQQIIRLKQQNIITKNKLNHPILIEKLKEIQELEKTKQSQLIKYMDIIEKTIIKNNYTKTTINSNHEFKLINSTSGILYISDTTNYITHFIKKGGTLETHDILANYDIFNTLGNYLAEITELITYSHSRSYINCNNVDYDNINSKVTVYKNTYIDDIITTSSIDSNGIITTSISDSYGISHFNDLLKLILRNKNKKDINSQFTIAKFEYDQLTHDYKISNNIYIFNKFTEYYDYNKYIILGFEVLLMQLIIAGNYHRYIERQHNYLAGLSREDINIIKAYTDPETFEQYINPFKRRAYVPSPEHVKAHPYISNSFADLIYIRLIRGELEANIDNNINIIRDFITKYDTDDLYTYIQCHDIYTILTIVDWYTILTDFLERLDNIITNAPAVTEPLILYRGSSSNYMNRTRGNVYESTEISSYTFNFNTAKHFYNIAGGFSNNNAIIYRVYVKPGVKLLFTTPIVEDILNRELEFLTAKDQKIYLDTNSSDSYDSINISYNNIHMTNNLELHDDNKFRTHKFLILDN